MGHWLALVPTSSLAVLLDYHSLSFLLLCFFFFCPLLFLFSPLLSFPFFRVALSSSAFSIARLLVDDSFARPLGGFPRVLLLPFLGAILMSTFDVSMDPMYSTMHQFWIWDDSPKCRPSHLNEPVTQGIIISPPSHPLWFHFASRPEDDQGWMIPDQCYVFLVSPC